MQAFLFARSRNRTGTTFLSQDFKSCASTNSAIRAGGILSPMRQPEAGKSPKYPALPASGWRPGWTSDE